MGDEAPATTTDGAAEPAKSAGRAPWAAGGLILQIAAVAVLVCLLAWGSLYFSRALGRVAPIWMANSVWLIFLLRAPKRRWPALLAAGLIGNIAACKFVVDPWPAAVGTSLANTLEVALCASGVAVFLNGRVRVGRIMDLSKFAAVAAVAAVVSAALGAACLYWIKGVPLLPSFFAWMLADWLALMILAPSLLALGDGSAARLAEPAMRPRALAFLAAMAGVLVVAAALPQHPLILMTAPLLMFAALQLELAGAAMGLLIVSAGVIGFIGLGWAPLSVGVQSLQGQLLSGQAYLGMLVISIFPVAAVMSGRRAMEAELVRSRDALQEANRLASMAEKLAGIGYWRAETGSPRFSWSEQMYNIYGRAPADGPPDIDSAGEQVHPDDREKLRLHRDVFGATEAPDLEVRIVRPSGEVRHVLIRSMVERNAAGAISARFGTVADITDIRCAEAAALESEQRYRFLADNAPDMITRTTMTGDMLYASPSSVRVLGHTPEEMRRQNAQEMVHPDDLERVMTAIFSLIEERRTRLAEPLCYRARHKDGAWVWIEANPMLIMDDRGEPVEFVDIVRNVTQAKLFEAELEEARRRAEAAAAAKSAFLANMSHELRTPLTSIIGFSRLVGERADLSEEARGYTRRIRDASEALLAIINDVLDFSKLEVGQVELETQPLSIQRLVEETTGLVTIQAAAKGLQVQAEIDPATPEQVNGDVARLRQVLLNFLSNAVKFTDEGAITVRIGYDPHFDGGRLRVAVEDTGVGIRPENLGRLFERFSQAELSINRTHGGTGLGLAISKGIVELMGGRIGVDSEVGRGSCFWFEIPAAPARAAAPVDAADGGDMDCPPLRLLVVDDTAMNRELVKLMLEPLGFVIEEASGGADGIQAAMTRPFDLVLMDVRMPGVDGLEATRVIRANGGLNARTPILALTADVQPENAAACRAAGMNDVLAKPIVPANLLGKIVQWGAPREMDDLFEIRTG